MKEFLRRPRVAQSVELAVLLLPSTILFVVLLFVHRRPNESVVSAGPARGLALVTLIGSLALLLTRWGLQLFISRRRTLLLVSVTLIALLLEHQFLAYWWNEPWRPEYAIVMLLQSGIAIFLLSQVALIAGKRAELQGDSEWIPGLHPETKEMIVVGLILSLFTLQWDVWDWIRALHGRELDLKQVANGNTMFWGQACAWQTRQLGLTLSFRRVVRVCVMIGGWIIASGLITLVWGTAIQGQTLYTSDLFGVFFLRPVMAVLFAAMFLSHPMNYREDGVEEGKPMPIYGRLFGPLFPKHYVPKGKRPSEEASLAATGSKPPAVAAAIEPQAGDSP